MIRLVTQFDDLDTRASVATPTCGGCCCCCCCCCVATVLSSSAITAMNLRAHALEREESQGSPSRWLEILGFLTLPSVIALVIVLLVVGFGDGAVAIGVAAWTLMLIVLYRWARPEGIAWTVVKTVLLTIVASFVELVPAAVLLFVSGAAGVIVYFLIAVLLAAAVGRSRYNRMLR